MFDLRKATGKRRRSHTDIGSSKSAQNDKSPDTIDFERLTSILESGSDVRWSSGLTSAVEQGEKERVWLLLKRGVDVNEIDETIENFRATPLEIAAQIGDLCMMRWLIEHGATFNVPLTDRPTALQRALRPAVVNYQPLRKATNRADVEEVVNFLLDAKADTNIEGWDNGRATALQTAASLNATSLGRLLIRGGAEINTRTKGDGCPLHTALGHGARDFIDMLLEKGADVDGVGDTYGGALSAAIVPNDYNPPMEDLVQRLLDLKADVNIKGGEYGSALQAAIARECSKDIIVQLLDRGADVNALGGLKGSALHAARDNVDIVELLLDRGADIDVVGINEYGMTFPVKGRGTLIQAAAFYQNIETVELLLQRGARVHRLEGEWGGVLEGAASARYNWPRWIRVIREILNKGVPVDDEGAQCGTALQCASGSGNLELVKMLLRKDANADAPSQKDGTALQRAAHGVHPEVVKLLLEYGAKAGVHDGESKSIIAWAVAGSGVRSRSTLEEPSVALEQAKHVISMLIRAGADINDQNGSALQEAVIVGDESMLEFILGHKPNVKLPDGCLHTALRCCRRIGGQKAIREILRSHEAVITPPVKHVPSHSGNVETRDDVEDPGILQTKILNEKLGNPCSIQDLAIGETLHKRFSSDEKVPYRQIRILGNGSIGSVDVVQMDTGGEQVFARKIFKVSPNDRSGILSKAKNEASVIQRLHHHHMVEFVATYATPTEFGIIMEPVADYDLAKYLTDTSSDRTHLAKWFGCLAAGLSYLHGEKIKHKDIKPENLLIKNNNILYADFNISRAFQAEKKAPPPDAGADEAWDGFHSLSLGFTDKTPMYCAPEVAREEVRGRKADVFSLGCVFLEMCTVFLDRSLDEFYRFRWTYPSHAYYANPIKVLQWIFRLAASLHAKSDWETEEEQPPRVCQAMSTNGQGVCTSTLDSRYHPLEWCIAMLQPVAENRISATNLLRTIRAQDIMAKSRNAAGPELPCYIASCCKIPRFGSGNHSEMDTAIHLTTQWPLLTEASALTEPVDLSWEKSNTYCGYEPHAGGASGP
ncbi:ankyrin repeat-containing domain protein [Aspergillus coremiiformis]|uniref:Ankyrin repeat-containing domain protein n=1 Tax=Aspergillus coremiiformis TaxID=138285 RepID=A0A5N6Z1F4_9EURO|nr:ankyrin repeat-containing domain protein [Aspergillus coremiiformis]